MAPPICKIAMVQGLICHELTNFCSCALCVAGRRLLQLPLHLEGPLRARAMDGS